MLVMDCPGSNPCCDQEAEKVSSSVLQTETGTSSKPAAIYTQAGTDCGSQTSEAGWGVDSQRGRSPPPSGGGSDSYKLKPCASTQCGGNSNYEFGSCQQPMQNRVYPQYIQQQQQQMNISMRSMHQPQHHYPQCHPQHSMTHMNRMIHGGSSVAIATTQRSRVVSHYPSNGGGYQQSHQNPGPNYYHQMSSSGPGSYMDYHNPHHHQHHHQSSHGLTMAAAYAQQQHQQRVLTSQAVLNTYRQLPIHQPKVMNSNQAYQNAYQQPNYNQYYHHQGIMGPHPHQSIQFTAGVMQQRMVGIPMSKMSQQHYPSRSQVYAQQQQHNHGYSGTSHIPPLIPNLTSSQQHQPLANSLSSSAGLSVNSHVDSNNNTSSGLLWHSVSERFDSACPERTADSNESLKCSGGLNDDCGRKSLNTSPLPKEESHESPTERNSCDHQGPLNGNCLHGGGDYTYTQDEARKYMSRMNTCTALNIPPFFAFSGFHGKLEKNRSSPFSEREINEYMAFGRMCSWEWNPTPAQVELFDKWKTYCVEYLVSCKEGVNIRGIPKYLAELNGESPPLTKMGFRTINQFLYEMYNREGLVDFRTLDGQYFVFIRDSAVPSYLAHIRKEVLGQSKDKSCKDKNGQIRRPTRAQSLYVSPMDIIEAVQDIINIPEDKYQPREPVPVVSKPKSTGRPRQRPVTSKSKTTMPRKTLACTRSSSTVRAPISNQLQRPNVAFPRLVTRQISVAASRPVLKPIPIAAKQAPSNVDVKTRMQQAIARLNQEAGEDKENNVQTNVGSAACSVVQTNTSANGTLPPSVVKTTFSSSQIDELNWTTDESDDGRMPCPTEEVAKPVASSVALPSLAEVSRLRQDSIAKLTAANKTTTSNHNSPRGTKTPSSALTKLPTRDGPVSSILMRVAMGVVCTLDQVTHSPSSDTSVELWGGSREDFEQVFEQLYRGGGSKQNLSLRNTLLRDYV